MNAIYARQSVEKQDSLSIETQIESCARSIQGSYQVYQDRGFSGKNTRRPAFQRLLREIREGRVRKVWVYRLDRFSRSIADFGQLWGVLERHQVAFESVSEKFDTTTPGGRAMLNIIMAFAQLERETTAERVRDNYYHRFALGSWPGGPAPLGFSLRRAADETGRTVSALAPDERAELVRRIFRDYLLPGASCGGLAKALTAEGVPGIRRAGWDSVAISRILRNPVYVMADGQVYCYFAARGVPIEQPAEAFSGTLGCFLVGKRDRSGGDGTSPRLSLSSHRGLVPAHVWLAAQEKLSQNRQLDRTHAGKHSWLSGLMKCARCGYAVKISASGDALYLHCSGRANLHICEQRFSIDLRALEGAVESELDRLLAACPDEPGSSDAGHAPDDALRQIDQKIDRLLSAFAGSSSVTAGYLNRQLTMLDQERQRLLRRPPPPAPGGLRRIVFPELSLQEKKLVAAQFLERVSLDADRAEVLWKL